MRPVVDRGGPSLSLLDFDLSKPSEMPPPCESQMTNGCGQVFLSVSLRGRGSTKSFRSSHGVLLFNANQSSNDKTELVSRSSNITIMTQHHGTPPYEARLHCFLQTRLPKPGSRCVRKGKSQIWRFREPGIHGSNHSVMPVKIQ